MRRPSNGAPHFRKTLWDSVLGATAVGVENASEGEQEEYDQSD